MHIAIIGCGQLSRMLALAGIPLGFRFTFIADTQGQDTRCVEHLGEIVQWHPRAIHGRVVRGTGPTGRGDR